MDLGTQEAILRLLVPFLRCRPCAERRRVVARQCDRRAAEHQSGTCGRKDFHLRADVDAALASPARPASLLRQPLRLLTRQRAPVR